MLVLCGFIIAAGPLAAQADAPDTAAQQRARIAFDRAEVEANFKTQEKACYSKFAVNDCLSAARAVRREALADLRRQEVSLNDADRKRKGAERQREIEERSATALPSAPGQAAKPRPDQGEREAQAARRAADRTAREASLASQPDRAAQARQRLAQQDAQRRRMEADRGHAAGDAAQAAKRREEQRIQAQQHRDSVDHRVAEQKKRPAQPLPQPAE
jgi:hypothetical protein